MMFKKRFKGKFWWPDVLLLLLLSACAPTPLPDTGPQVPASVLNIDRANFTLEHAGLATSLADGAGHTVELGDTLVTDASGRGVLKVGELAEVEFLSAGQVRLAGVLVSADGPAFVSLAHSAGHVFVRQKEGAPVTVLLDTGEATLTTLDPGTAFTVCFKAGTVTCGAVQQGRVEFLAQGVRQIASQGEAIFVFTGQPPSETICMQQNDFDRWLAQMRAGEAAPSLSQLVASWPQMSCAELAQVNQSPPAEAPPSEAPPSEAPPAQVLPDGAGMVKIEAGTYVLGAAERSENYAATRSVDLPAFWIDQYEVTQAQYAAFLEAQGRATSFQHGQERYPAVGLTWQDAVDYCASIHKRLPSEAEWEAAGRGLGDSPPVYPWGDDPLAGGYARSLPLDGPYEVGAIDFNRSPSGVYDLSGNAWEWVADPYDPVPGGAYVLRGGRFSLIKPLNYRQVAAGDDPRFVENAGVRCAADQVSGG